MAKQATGSWVMAWEQG